MTMHRMRRNTLSLSGICLGTALLVALSASAGCQQAALAAPARVWPWGKPSAVSASSPRTVAFDRVSLSYDHSLASGVEAEAVEAVPFNPEWLPADTHPSYVQFRFEGYQKGKGHWLPYPLEGPQVMVYRTEEFAAFGDDPTGFSRQLETLQALLEDRPDLTSRVAAAMDQEPQETPYLPFLPWLNSTQAFCAQPRYIEFQGGGGIRYLTAFLQEAAISDSQVFYTFQGITDDGTTYIVAVLPLTTAAFTDQGGAEVGLYGPDAWRAFLAEGVGRLDAQSEGRLAPTLAALDAMMKSIEVGR